MLEVSVLANKIENILNVMQTSHHFKIFTDLGEMEKDNGLIKGTEQYVCGILEIFSNDLSGEGLKFQDILFQLTWFVDGKKTGSLGNRKAENVENVRNILAEFAENYNNKNIASEQFGGDYYSTTYSVKLPTNQQEIKNFGYMQSCVPMTQIIETVLIENGVNANAWKLQANNEKLVYQSLSISNEKQAQHNIISNEKRTKGIIQSSGICFDLVIPQLKTNFCNLVEKDVLKYEEDEAVCVYCKGNEAEDIYICVLGSDSANLQPNVNVGMNVALVEGVEDMLHYSNDWTITEVITTTENEEIRANANGRVFWGDGQKTILSKGELTHIFEVPGTYTIRTFGTFTLIENEEGGDE